MYDLFDCKMWLSLLKITSLFGIRVYVLLIIWPRCTDTDNAYLGCFYDNFNVEEMKTDLNLRVLPLGKLQSNSMTIGTCVNHCVDYRDDIRYAGVEDGSQCFCGTADADYSQNGLGKLNDEECSEKCTGNKNQTCGEGFRIAVYNLSLIRCQIPEMRNFLNSGDLVSVQSITTLECLLEYTLIGTPSVQCIFDDSITDARWETRLPRCTLTSSDYVTTTEKHSSVKITTNLGNSNTMATNSGGAIAGAVIGVCFLVVAISSVIYYVYVWKRRDTAHSTDDEHVEEDDSTSSRKSKPTGRDDNTASDAYIDLDPASRIKEAEYQGIYTHPVQNDASNRDSEYQEVFTKQTEDTDSRRMPVPPPVIGLTDSDSYYMNVKQNY